MNYKTFMFENLRLPTVRAVVYKLFKLSLLTILPITFVNAQTTYPDDDMIGGIEYNASYSDLSNLFGTNADAGMDNYVDNAVTQNRDFNFDSCNYIASYPDLMTAFDTDTFRGGSHYITYGRFEGRAVSFNGYQYMLANPDVLQASSDVSELACEHYIVFGRFDLHRTVPGKLVVGVGNKCLDAGSIAPTANSQVVLWQCFSFQPPQHQWTLKDNGQVVGLGGQCLSTANGQLIAGTPILMQPCVTGAANQAWILNQDENLVSLADETMCVEVAGASTANGAPVWLSQCSGDAGQSWTVSGGNALVGVGGKCMDAGATWVGHTQAVLYTCYPYAPQQQWVFAKGQVQGLGGQCLSITGGVSGTNNSSIVMAPCGAPMTATGQNWYLRSDGLLASIDVPNLCVNVQYGSTADSAPLIAYTCSAAAPNERWVQA